MPCGAEMAERHWRQHGKMVKALKDAREKGDSAEILKANEHTGEHAKLVKDCLDAREKQDIVLMKELDSNAMDYVKNLLAALSQI